LIIGDFEGRLHWFENIGGAGNAANYQLKQQQFANIDVGASAIPMLADVSGDGKLDLVIGEQMGNLNYFENTGSTTLPQFSAIPTNSSFGNIDVQAVCCTGYSSPFLFKNAANKWELLLGTDFGEVWHYDNIDNNLTGTFHLISQHFGNIKTAGRCAIAGADINNDGAAEWIVGNIRGGLELFTNQGSIGVEEAESHAFDVYPNPANAQIMLTFPFSFNANSIDVFTLLGKKIYTKSIVSGDTALTIDSDNWEEGLYFIRVRELYQKVWIAR
jgi:Secretion system C-terminal sorting domain